MPFVKIQKSNAYFSRFQVKYRRRQEGKTNRKLIAWVYNPPRVGLTNYSDYAGLLVARRAPTKLGLADKNQCVAD